MDTMTGDTSPLASTSQLFKLSSDDAEANFAHTEVVKGFVFDQGLWPGTVEVSVAPMFNPDLIESWALNPPGNLRLGGVKQPEWVILK